MAANELLQEVNRATEKAVIQEVPRSTASQCGSTDTKLVRSEKQSQGEKKRDPKTVHTQGDSPVRTFTLSRTAFSPVSGPAPNSAWSRTPVLQILTHLPSPFSPNATSHHWNQQAAEIKNTDATGPGPKLTCPISMQHAEKAETQRETVTCPRVP